MWLLQFVPDSLIHLLVLAGIVGCVINIIPFVPGKSITKFLGPVLLAIGMYAEGGITERKIWETRILELKVEVERVRAEAAKITTKTVIKYVDKIKIVRENGDEIIKVVEKFVPVVCVPNGIVQYHNDSAANRVPIAPRDLDESCSGVDSISAAKTIAENYKRYHELKAQLEALQGWIREQEQLHKVRS